MGGWKHIALVCLVCLVSGCTLLPKEKEVLKPPLVKPQKESYNTYEVKRGTVTKQLKGKGIFESTKAVIQQFKAAGKITTVYAKTGDIVKQGAPLHELDNEGLEITVMERERDLKKAQLALDRAKLSREQQTIEIGLVELGIAQIKLSEARRQLEGKVMTAEIDGMIVSMEKVKPGDTVQPGKDYVTIADPTSLRLSYTGTLSGELQEVQAGMKAEITYKNRQLEAIVTQSPSSAPQTNNKQLSDKYARTIYFKLADPAVTPELNASADIVILLQKKENVIVIPRNGMIRLLGRTFVKVLDGESIKEIDVEQGLESQSEIEIVKGLQEGQKIILQ